MFHLEFPEARVTGASPEVLVRLRTAARRGAPDRRHAAARRAPPTRTRALAAELRADPKERAEHLMLIDLGRNDVGRVAAVGTRARRPSRWSIERYSHVMHLTSHVVGHAAPTARRWLDVLRAAFPAGTLSGAPKIRAMEIIDELEPHQRGIYGGAVGYVSYTGNLDLAIAIRTLVTKRRHDLRAGRRGHRRRHRCPTPSTRRCVNKARAVLRAVAMARHARRRRVVKRPARSTTTTRSPTTSPSTSASSAPRCAVERNDAITRRRRSRERAPRRDRDLAGPVHAERGRHLAGRDRARSPARCRSSASASATSASARRSAARSCARRAIMHGKTSKIFHDEQGAVRRRRRTRSRRRATTRCVIEPRALPDALEVTAKTLGGRDHGRAPQDAAASRACSSTPSRS